MSHTTTRLKRKRAAPATQTPIHITTPNKSVFDQLPDSAYLRESQLVRSPKRPDSLTAPLPFSAPTLWRMVKAGKFPAPTRLSTRVTAWKVSDVRDWMNAQAAV